MFTIYHSNQLDVLKTLAGTIISGQPLRDPFRSEVILVQSNGMAQWMQMELATQLGIAANIEFLPTSRFIWQMFARVLPDISADENVFAKSAMTWRLMALLPRLCEHTDFASISNYLSDDEDKRKSFQFAVRMADLFDQYLIYRPDWLESWQRGKSIDGLGKAQRWQASLWRAILLQMEQTEKQLWCRTNLYERFIQTVKESQKRPLGLPDRVFICGVSALPPVYLEVLQALGRYIDVHLLFMNPCRYYWGDIPDRDFLARLLRRRRRHYQRQTNQKLFRRTEQSDELFNELREQQNGNTLLTSWGKQGRDTLYLLAQMDSIVEVDAFLEPMDHNLLSLLQRDILMLEDYSLVSMNPDISKQAKAKRPLQIEDRSLRLHVCHSPQREVEVLHDCLLAMIKEDPTLQPRDIIVMAADIDRYTPSIQAVFGNIEGSHNLYLPFTISDQRALNLHPVLLAFLRLLDLPRSRFAAEQILALLEVPALAARFSINNNRLQLLRQWVTESGIRWGLDDDTIRELTLPTTGQHTWQFGLTRMLLGYAMDSDSGDWLGISPYNESSGLISELVGQLAELLMRLRKWRDQLIKPRYLNAWLSCAREMSEDFFTIDGETRAALIILENQWQQLIKCGLQAKYGQPVPVTILRDELAARLDQERISQNFLSGAINFCALMPMRSIPFRVVCLLGMNDGIYPSTVSSVGFDLMAQQPRRGDRSRRDDDRYLFLEILMSAQQRLYISFIGRTIRDNTLCYPSILVSELTDYISHSFYLPGDEFTDTESSAERIRTHLWQWHSRMPFSPKNFLPNSENQSFANEWLPAASASGKPRSDFITPLIKLPCVALELDELLKFYHHPVRAWFVQRLGVSFHEKVLELTAHEPFIVDSLTRYHLNDRLVSAIIAGENPIHLFSHARASGILPYGAFGELYWTKQYQDMAELAEQVRRWQLPEKRNIEINLKLDGIMLTGWLLNVQKNGLLRWRPSVLSIRDGLLLWIEHLAYCAIGGKNDSRMFGVRSEWHFAPLPADQAKLFLLSLISGYRQGMTAPLFLLPTLGGIWLSNCYDRTTKCIDRSENRQQKACDKLIRSWRGSSYSAGEDKDPYLQRLMRQLNQQHIRDIISEAERYLLPLFIFNIARIK